MFFDNATKRRINDEDYNFALSEFLKSVEINDAQKVSRRMQQRIDKKLNNMSLDEFMGFLQDYWSNPFLLKKIAEFNKQWDKKNYKVIPLHPN